MASLSKSGSWRRSTSSSGEEFASPPRLSRHADTLRNYPSGADSAGLAATRWLFSTSHAPTSTPQRRLPPRGEIVNSDWMLFALIVAGVLVNAGAALYNAGRQRTLNVAEAAIHKLVRDQDKELRAWALATFVRLRQDEI